MKAFLFSTLALVYSLWYNGKVDRKPVCSNYLSNLFLSLEWEVLVPYHVFEVSLIIASTTIAF